MKTKSPLFPPRRVVEIFVAKGRKQHVATRYKNVHEGHLKHCCFALHDTQTLLIPALAMSGMLIFQNKVIITIIPFIQCNPDYSNPQGEKKKNWNIKIVVYLCFCFVSDTAAENFSLHRKIIIAIRNHLRIRLLVNVLNEQLIFHVTEFSYYLLMVSFQTSVPFKPEVFIFHSLKLKYYATRTMNC